MAKFNLFHLCVLAASLYTVCAVTEEEFQAIRKAMGPIIEACSAEYNVTSDNIQEAKENKNANALKPCFIECVMRRVGILDTDSYYDADRGLHKIRRFLRNDDDFAKFEKVARKCMKVNNIPLTEGETRCDRALFVLECAFENIAEMPLK